jgi:DNA-binding Lrp family transcriptional regulator
LSTDEGQVKTIDALDRAILQALHVDPHATNKAMAKQLGVSEPTIAARIESMVARKVMRVSVQRNINRSEFRQAGMIDISVRGRAVAEVAQALTGITNLVSITTFADDPQLHVLLMARDPAHLQAIVDDEIAPLAGIASLAVTVCVDDFYLAPGIAVL